MNPDIKREFFQHAAFAVFFLLGLMSADRMMGDHPIFGGSDKSLTDSAVVENRREDSQAASLPSRSVGYQRVIVAKPALDSVSSGRQKPSDVRGSSAKRNALEPQEVGNDEAADRKLNETDESVDQSTQESELSPHLSADFSEIRHQCGWLDTGWVGAGLLDTGWLGNAGWFNAKLGLFSVLPNHSVSLRGLSWANDGNANAKPDDEDGSALAAVQALEEQRIATINQVAPAVVCIFGLERQGGGSGVLIHPSGLALTNHHVVAACGIEGWGGLSDGKLYRWRLVGNDPGGDLALIKLEGMEEFPFVQLGDSDQVQVGDWTLVMGNPFTLADDYWPTVTHGIVSGIHRYQPGMADVLLVYGDCLQVDTSINPGNSGGPLFDMQGRLLGINGRASFDFQTRGRVNVGLGYAISVNQCRNFLPELMATKLVQHGTLDAVFQDRDGQVVCAAMYEDSEVGRLGMQLGDAMLEFEGREILSANQFTNLICTLPAGWPAQLKMQRPDGSQYEIGCRLLGLPYPKTAKEAIEPKKQEPEKQPEQDPNAPQRPDEEAEESEDGKEGETPEPVVGRNDKLRQEIAESKKALGEFLKHEPGVPQFDEVQQAMSQLWLQRWQDHRHSRRRKQDAGGNAAAEPDKPDPDKLKPGNLWQIRELVQVTDGPQYTSEVLFDGAADRWAMRVTLRTEKAGWDAQGQTWTACFGYRDGQWQEGSKTDDGKIQWSAMTQAQVMEHTFGSQLVWLRFHSLQDQSLPLSDWELAGVGKAGSELAVRLQNVSQDTPQNLWLKLDDWTKASEVRLLKTSEDEDGRYDLGATLYRQWKPMEVGQWPVQRQIVFGLLQEVRASIETEECRQVPAETAWWGE